MEKPVDDVEARLAELEVIVAKGFHETASQFQDAELRDLALSRKIDVATETRRGDIGTVIDAVTYFGEEMRRMRRP